MKRLCLDTQVSASGSSGVGGEGVRAAASRARFFSKRFKLAAPRVRPHSAALSGGGSGGSAQAAVNGGSGGGTGTLAHAAARAGVRGRGGA